MFLFLRAGILGPYKWVTGEERPVTTDSLDAVSAFEDALDDLFIDYDKNVVSLINADSIGARMWADSMVSALTLEEKIGQLFIANLSSSTSSRARNDALEAVQDNKVGGFLVSRAMDPQDVHEMTSLLQSESNVPLFFAADYERGVGRFSNNLTEMPSNMGLGATRDPLFAAAAGRLTAIEGRAVGVNMVFAPVVDVNNNPENPTINIRSYGEDPELVGLMAKKFVSQAQALGMLTTLKHFPGHGNSEVDSHSRMGTIYGDRTSLNEIELYPYRLVFSEPVQPSAVMSAHLWSPAFDSEPLPATFSRNLLQNLLRDSLSFNGLIITDDVKMGALQNDYSLEERVVNPLLAGADIVLTPRDLERSIEVVKDAVEDGTVTMEALNRSVHRILMTKASSGLHQTRSIDKPLLDYLLAAPRGERLAQAAADRAVTLLQNDNLLPLDTGKKIALVQLANIRNSPSIEAAMDLFSELVTDSLVVEESRVGMTPGDREISQLMDEVEEADAVIVVMYLRLRAGRGEAGLYEEQEELLDDLVGMDKPVVVVTLGNPYAIMPYSDAEALLVAYEQSMASVRSVASIISGVQDPGGKLPITVGQFAYGSGLEKTRPNIQLALDEADNSPSASVQ